MIRLDCVKGKVKVLALDSIRRSVGVSSTFASVWCFVWEPVKRSVKGTVLGYIEDSVKYTMGRE